MDFGPLPAGLVHDWTSSRLVLAGQLHAASPRAANCLRAKRSERDAAPRRLCSRFLNSKARSEHCKSSDALTESDGTVALLATCTAKAYDDPG